MLQAALVGTPFSGKSTLFQLLTEATPQEGRHVNQGVAKIPDPRLDRLCEVYKPRKVTPAALELLDLPGLSPGSASGEAKRFLSDVRQVDALVHVIDGFSGQGDPAAALEAVDTELVIADLEVVERRLERLAKGKGKGEDPLERPLLTRLEGALSEGRRVAQLQLTDEERHLLAGYTLLTEKPMLVVYNKGEEPPDEAFMALSSDKGLEVTVMSAQMEMEIKELPGEERAAFLADLGFTSSGIERLARAMYRSLDLISFLTAGEDEVRAWTIDRGTEAREAAGKIHSDIARGFIRAEVVSYEDFERCAFDMNKAKEAGLWRLEGKTYVVADGDIISFRFNA